MNINELLNKVPDMMKVADVVPNPEWNKMVDFKFCVDKEIQKSSKARIYVISADSEIIKIGGSADKSGIFQTLKWYKDGFSGKPDRSGRTLGVPIALLAAIECRKKVEIFMFVVPTFKIQFPNITGEYVELETSGYKPLETLWVEEYKKSHGGRAPVLNKQENKDKHSQQIEDAMKFYFNLIHNGVSSAKKPQDNKRTFSVDEQKQMKELINKAVESCKYMFIKT